MLKLIALFIFACVSLQGKAQYRNYSSDYDKYQKRYKTQKTAAILLAAAGGGILAYTALAAATHSAGGTILTAASLGTYSPPRKSYTAPLIVGLTVGAASVPFFISASKNRDKAIEASLGFQLRSVPEPILVTGLAHISPTISVTITM